MDADVTQRSDFAARERTAAVTIDRFDFWGGEPAAMVFPTINDVSAEARAA